MATTFWPIQASESGVTVGTYLQQKLSTSEGTTNYVITTTTTTASGNHIEISDLGATIWLYRVRPVTISGSISFKVWGLESAMTVNAQPGVRIVRIDSSGTILSDVVADANAGHVPASEWGTAVASKSWSATPTSTAFSDGDWIGVIIHADAIGTMAAGSMNINYDGSAANNADTLITFTETILGYTPPQPAQAQALIINTKKFAQAQAQIKTIGINSYAQAQAYIRPRVGLAQVQASIIDTKKSAQAAGLINGTYFLPFSDTFTRTVVDGMGISNNGDTWTYMQGTAANFDVDGSKLIITSGFTSTYDLRKTLVKQSVSRSGYEISYQSSISNYPTSGYASVKTEFGLASVRDLSTTHPSLSYEITSSGNIYTSIVYDDNVSNSGFQQAYTAGDMWNFKIQVVPTSEQRIRWRTKCWKVGTSEPGWDTQFSSTVIYFEYWEPQHIRLVVRGSSDPAGPFTITLDNFAISEAWWTEVAQAQAQIKAIGIKGYAQAQVSIRPRVGLAQVAGLINGTYFMPFSDTFTRTVSNGLGVSDNGDTWQIVRGPAANFSTDGSKASIIFESAAYPQIDLYKTLINPIQGVEISASVYLDKVPTTNGLNMAFVLSSSVPAYSTFGYGQVLYVNPTYFTSSILDLRAAVESNNQLFGINSRKNYSTYTINFKVHFIKASGNTIVVRRKTWRSSDNEPGWEDEETLTFSASPTLVGHPAIHLNPDEGDANRPFTITIDNLQILEAGLTYYAQAQAQIKAIGINSYAQAQVSIRPKVGLAQVAGLINGTYFMPFSDTFNRTVGSGLGTSDNTDTWTIILGTAANASVDGTKAIFVTEVGNQTTWDLQKTLINPSKGVEISGTISIDKIPDTATWVISFGLHRSNNTSNGFQVDNNLWFDLAFYTSDQTDLRVNVGGILADGIGNRESSYVGHPLSFKVHAIKTGETFRVRKKLWKSDTVNEPGWEDDEDITATAFPLAGHPRIILSNIGLNTNGPFTVTLDNLQILEAGLTYYAQAQASIVLYERIRIQAQAQARIYAFKVRGYGLAQTYISPSFGQNRFGQAQAVTAPKYTLPFMDNFNRPDQAGMGTAPNGDTWQISQGNVIFTNLNNSYITRTYDNALLFNIWILPQTSFSHPASTSPFILEFTITFRFYIKNSTSGSVYLHFGFNNPYEAPNNVGLGVEISNVDYGGDSGSLNTRLNVGAGNSFTTSTVGDSNFILGEVTWIKARFHFTPGAGSTTYVSVSITNPYQEHFSDSSKAFIFNDYANTVTKSVIFKEPITLHTGIGIGNKVSIEEISIEIVSPYSVANAQAYIGSFKVAQARARIYAFNVQKYAQAQADLGKIKYAQAQAFIGSLRYAQANAKIKVLGWEIVAQSGAFIKKSAAFGQAQVKIKATSTNFSTPYSQAQASIIQSSPMAHAQAQADLGRIKYAQAQTVIKATNREFAQSQANIKTVNLLYAQVQAQIKTNYIFYAQAQTYIKQIYQSYAQAQAMLYIPQVSSPQTDLQNTGWEGVVI